MKTEYMVGNIRIRFESRARRRWFVVMVYASLAAFDLVWIPGGDRDWFHEHARWVAVAIMFVCLTLNRVFSRLTGDIDERGDERETHRREHAYAKAYPVLGYFLIGALFAAYFRGSNPITPLAPPVLREVLLQLPFMLLGAAGIVYITLPQAILLWTEPDMEAQ